MKAKELYVAHPVDFSRDDWERTMQENEARLSRIDREAIDAGVLAGRVIYYPVADGYALYQVIRTNKKTARIRQCVGIGDDYRVLLWGDEATIPLSQAEWLVGRQDALDRLFGGGHVSSV